MISRRGLIGVAPLILALGVFLFHLPRLGVRPMHTDEAVHAVKLGELLETGHYVYNPHEFHGPTLYDMTVPFELTAGAHDTAGIPGAFSLRVVTILCGALLVALIGFAERELGNRNALIAALLVGLSPPFAFYSRYYIQEVPFVLFSFLFLWSFGRLLASGGWKTVVATGLSLGCLMATKETWILVVTATGASAILASLASPGTLKREIPWKNLAVRLAVAFLVSVFVATMLLTNFFRDPGAWAALWTAVSGYIHRGATGDSGSFGSAAHRHPWNYYFSVFWQPSNFRFLDVIGQRLSLLLGAGGILFVLLRYRAVPPVWRFIALFAVIITLMYSAIPYKTPWNGLLPLAAILLMASFSIELLLASVPKRAWKIVVVSLAILLAAALAHETWLDTLKRPGDPRIPFAYSPTVEGIDRLETRVSEMARFDPDGNNLVIYVVAPGNDYWPLPWYLRHYPRIGYFTSLPDSLDSASMVIVIGQTNDGARFPESDWQDDFFGLRPDVLARMYIRRSLWDDFIKSQESP